MRIKTTYFFLAFVFAVSGAFAQEGYIKDVVFEKQTAVKEGNKVSVYMDVLLDNLTIKSNDLLVITPVLEAHDHSNSLELAPIFIAGNRRNKVLQRNVALGNKPQFYGEPQTIVTRKNESKQVVNYSSLVPYSSWMENASLVVKETIKGCADCSRELEGLFLANVLVPKEYIPTYKLTYIVPVVEQVKARADRHSASFNYVVGKYELLRDFKNNAAVINKVDKIVSEVISNEDINITEFTVSGYSSPEGSFTSNQSLSAKRATSFANYLNQKHGIKEGQLKVEGFGEDWEGLRKAIASASLQDSDEVLHIIDNISNPDARDAELRKLSNGQTYQTLLNTYYPPLRRTDYTIAYNVRAFDVKEAREVIKTNPKHLSLNEMYLVAQSYDAASKEFKEVFDIAVRMFPNEPIAIVNSAATDIEGGNNQGAIDRLSKIKTNARVWNNMGVALARTGELDKAMEYFEKAVAEGDDDAKNNIEELQKVMKSKIEIK